MIDAGRSDQYQYFLDEAAPAARRRCSNSLCTCHVLHTHTHTHTYIHTHTFALTQVRAVSSGQMALRINSFHSCYKDTGLFGVYVSTNPDRCHEMIRLIGDTFQEFVSFGEFLFLSFFPRIFCVLITRDDVVRFASSKPENRASSVQLLS